MARRVLHDRYFKQAKAEGYRSRAAYKLIQIDEAKKLLSPGDAVLDLGCAPGAWLQVAAERVGERGVVVGVDLQEVRGGLPANVRAIRGDINEIDASALLGLAGRRFGVVLSDMAPSTSGHGDAERSAQLCFRVLDLVPALLRPGGHLAMKILEGGLYPQVLERSRSMFAEARGYKPKSSREVSREMFVVAKGWRGDGGGGSGDGGGGDGASAGGRKVPPHVRWGEEMRKA